MNSPITGKEMKLSVETRKVSFRKENLEIPFQFYLCEDTGEQFTTTDLDELNLQLLHNQYRAKHHIPLPDEITKIRKQYGLTSSRMGEILGFGPNTYGNYEKGEVPSLPNANLIKMAKDPNKFLGLARDWQTISLKAKDELLLRIEHLIKQKDAAYIFLEKYLMGDFEPGIYTGYREPDFERLREMIVFFAQEIPCFKTKMNKLLFYADFGMFKSHGQSISGSVYKAIPYGPVPYSFESIFEQLATKDVIDMDYEDLPNGGQKQYLRGRKDWPFRKDLFSEAEISMLHQVRDLFNRTNAKDIVDISHQEAGWLENQESKCYISYTHALTLKGI